MNAVTFTPTLGYILKGYPRISESFISNEILLLERLGFRLHLFPMRHPRESFCHDSVKQIKARVDYLPTELLLDFPHLLIPNIFLAVKRPNLFRKGLALAGLRYQRNNNLATFKHMLQAGFLTNHHLLGDHSLTHLHGHFAHSPTSVTMFAALLSGRSFSFTAHAKDIYTSNPDQLREKIKLAQFVVTCTEYNRRYLEEISEGLNTPIHCIYHGIDLDLFTPSTDHTEATPPYKLLTVARMTEKKGLPTVYNALKILKAKGFRFTHTLIGDGDDRDSLLKLISDLQLDDCCHWLGTRTHTEVLKQFEQSDLFVLGCEIAPNGDRDGIPNVLVESLAMDVPALSTTVSALPEILIDQETGITVQAGDAKGMAGAIEKILINTELRKKIIQGGSEHTRKHFDNRSLASDLGAIFAKQLGCKAPLPLLPPCIPPEAALVRTMRICLYAPFKPLGHPHPSGDLIIATGLHDFLVARGHQVMIASDLRSRWIYWKPWLFPRIAKELFTTTARVRQFSPDIWLTYHSYYKAPDLLGPSLCKRLKIPYVIFQGIYSSKQRRSLYGFPGFFLNRHALQQADHLFTNRLLDQENLLRIIPRDRLSYISPGIFPEQFNFNQQARTLMRREWQTKDEPVLLSAAMFRPDVKTQGLTWLIKTLAKLTSQGSPMFKLIIAGDGSERAGLVSLAEKLLPDRVLFVGRINRGEMYRFYSGGDIFVFPGIRESLGMVYLEAQSCGLPVIAFDNGGIPEVVQQGTTGLLTTPFDEDAFCQALLRLLKDVPQRKKMGQAAAKHVRTSHDLHKNYVKFEQLLTHHVQTT